MDKIRLDREEGWKGVFQLEDERGTQPTFWEEKGYL
jgi:hypothetical protein